MIVLFQTFFIVTNYIITLLTKSIFYTNRNEDEHKNAQYVFSYDKDYVMESDAEIEEGIGVRFFPPVYVQRYAAVKHVLQDERWCGKIRKVKTKMLMLITIFHSNVGYVSGFNILSLSDCGLRMCRVWIFYLRERPRRN